MLLGVVNFAFLSIRSMAMYNVNVPFDTLGEDQYIHSMLLGVVNFAFLSIRSMAAVARANADALMSANWWAVSSRGSMRSRTSWASRGSLTAWHSVGSARS